MRVSDPPGRAFDSRGEAHWYWRRTVLHPASVFALVWLLLIAVIAGGVLGAVLAGVAGTVLTSAVSRARTIRRWIDRQVLVAQREQRTNERLARLAAAGAERQQQFKELDRLVGEVEDNDVGNVQLAPLDLQGLLERYIDLSAADARLADAVERAGRRLPFAWLDEAAAPGRASPTMAEELAQRRRRHKQLCQRQRAAIRSKIDAIMEFVLLVNQKAATQPFEDELAQDLAWRLADLDAQETAYRQLVRCSDLE
jgi:hypothetical protein